MPSLVCNLPIELTLEILRAASPAHQSASDRVSCYSTARTLALVCFEARQLVMPFLLHTVVLDSLEALTKFIQTLQFQKHLAAQDSRLRLDYSQLVRRVWIAKCWEPILPIVYHQQQLLQPEATAEALAYAFLGEILSSAEELGFTFLSYHLVYDSFGEAVTERQWNCRRLTFAGYNPRWNPLTSTPNGQAFLQHLTHLTIWLPEGDSIGKPSVSATLDPRVPNWVQRIPFEYMTGLTHFAFTLVSTPPSTTMPVVVYIRSPSQHNATIFRTWATSPDPISYGQIVTIDVDNIPSPERGAKDWGAAFLKGENDIWPMAGISLIT